ncbi:MAG: hypothetical protein K2Q10_11835, partial [Rhodospirillales bacterium]|nr:hypothetical protein [Rhodospirillales bacterium]
QFGAAAYQLDLPQKTSVVELIADPGRLDGSMLRGAMARHACGLDVLTAPRQVYPLEVLAAEGVQRLIEAARREYRTVLVDLPPCWCAGLHAALGTADMAALVLLMSVPSIHQARRQMETLAEESLDGLPLALVANRVERGLFRKGVPRKEAEKALKRSLSLLISDEARLMAESANAGRPLGAVEGGGKLARALAGQIGSLFTTPAAGHAASA